MNFFEWRDYYVDLPTIVSVRNDIITDEMLNESYIIKVENGENFSFRKMDEASVSASPIKKVEMCVEDKEKENSDMEKIARCLNGDKPDEYSLWFQSVKMNFEEGVFLKEKFHSFKEISKNLIDNIPEAAIVIPVKEIPKVEEKPKEEPKKETQKEEILNSNVNDANQCNLPLKNEKEYKKKDIRIEIDKHDNFKSDITKINEESQTKPKTETKVVKKDSRKEKESDIFKEMKNSFNLKDDEIDDYVRDAKAFKLKKTMEMEEKQNKEVSVKQTTQPQIPAINEEIKKPEVPKEQKSSGFTSFKVAEVNSNTETKESQKLSQVKPAEIAKPKIEERIEKKQINEVKPEKEKRSEIPPESNKTNPQSESQKLVGIDVPNTEVKKEAEVEKKLDEPPPQTVSEQEKKNDSYIDQSVIDNFLENQSRKKQKNELLEKELSDKVNMLKQQNKVVLEENKKLLEILHLYKIIQNIESNDVNPSIINSIANQQQQLKTSKLQNRLKMNDNENKIEPNPILLEDTRSKGFNINSALNEQISKQNAINLVEYKDRKKETIVSNVTYSKGTNVKSKQAPKQKFKQFIDLKLISPESNTKSYKEIYKNQVRIKSPERESIYEEKKSNVGSPSTMNQSRAKNFINTQKSSKGNFNQTNSRGSLPQYQDVPEYMDNNYRGMHNENMINQIDNVPQPNNYNAPSSKGKEKNVLQQSNSSGNLKKFIHKNNKQASNLKSKK